MKSTPKATLSDSAQKKTKICPKCGKRKQVKEGFGLRNMAGVLRPQARCYACRSNTKFRKEAKPRGVLYEFVVTEDEVHTSEIAYYDDIVETPEIFPLPEGTEMYHISTVSEPQELTYLDEGNVSRLYAQNFPNDKQARGWKIRAKRLLRKPGTNFAIDERMAGLLGMAVSEVEDCPV